MKRLTMTFGHERRGVAATAICEFMKKGFFVRRGPSVTFPYGNRTERLADQLIYNYDGVNWQHWGHAVERKRLHSEKVERLKANVGFLEKDLIL